MVIMVKGSLINILVFKFQIKRFMNEAMYIQQHGSIERKHNYQIIIIICSNYNGIINLNVKKSYRNP